MPDTPEQHQEVDFEEEGEEADTEDQQDEKASETLVVDVLSKFIVWKCIKTVSVISWSSKRSSIFYYVKDTM